MEEPEIQELLKKVYAHGCKNVIATMGGRGQIFYNGSEFIKGKVYFVEPVDTMGAGDSYLAALIVSLLKKDGKGRCFAGRCDQAAMDDAAHYSSDNCLREGGFGFKNQIEE